MTKKEIKKLDNLVEKSCKENADYRCEICGTSWENAQIHAHHVCGRRNRSTRWLLENLVALCASHHTMGRWSAHEHPGWFMEEMRLLRGEDWWNKLYRLSHYINKMDFETNKYLMDKSLDEILTYYEVGRIFKNKFDPYNK